MPSSYTGTMINDLLTLVENVTERHLSRSGDQFDQLCEAKLALADAMTNEIHDEGHAKRTTVELWKAADRLQESAQ